MSSTLTWQQAGPQTKTGTTNATLVDDIVSLVNSKSGDSNFKWQVAASHNSNVFWVNLKRKDASAGRILLIAHSSAPAGNNSAIYQATPSSDSWGICYFPAGNVDSPSNLSSSSGTIMGDDTGAVKISGVNNIANFYTTSWQVSYWDSDEAVWFGFCNPAGSSQHMMGAGKIVVDASDNVYDGVFNTTSAAPWSTWASKASSPTWSNLATAINAGSATNVVIRTNYGATDRLFWQGMIPNEFHRESVGTSNDPMKDTGTTQVWFFPIPLVGRTKGVGFPLKLRQVVYGPPVATSYETYNESGPTVMALSSCMLTTPTANSTNGMPWFVNFKM